MQLMLDLETMSTKPNAAIVSMGAVVFDTEVQATFYRAVSLSSCMELGLAVDASTIEWWLRQSEEARSSTFTSNAISINQALLDFDSFCRMHDVKEVWGNGATFDNVILDSAYKAAVLKRPWSYKGDRCYRTLAALFPQLQKPKPTVSHNALADAEAQAVHCIELLRKINECNS